MRKTVFFVFFVSLVVSNLSAQNWDINTLHRVNSWDNKFVRNYNKFISRSEPYVAIGVPVAMALTAWAKKRQKFIERCRICRNKCGRCICSDLWYEISC